MVRRFTARTPRPAARPVRTLLRLEPLLPRDVPSVSVGEDVHSLPRLAGMSADYPTDTAFTDDTPGGYTANYREESAVADDTPGGYSDDLEPVQLLDQPRPRLAVATGVGHTTTVHVFDGPTGAMLGTLTPFGDAYTAGARVATGDVTGDGVADVVTASGPGVAPQVKVFDGKTLVEASRLSPYEATFTGGVFVAVGDVTGDGRADVVTAAGDGGGPLVKVFDGANPTEAVRSYFAYEPEFRGGATVAVGDVDGDRVADIVTGAGVGGGPRVVVISGRTGGRLQDFFAFDNGTRGGVSVSVGTVAGKATLATALLDGSGNQVRLFQNGYQTAMFTPFDAGDGTPQPRTPATVTLKDLTGDGADELVVATPTGQSQLVKILDPLTGAARKAFPAVTPEYAGGLFIG